MKKLAKTTATLMLLILLVSISANIALAGKPVQFDSQGNEVGWENSSANCTKIQDGLLEYSASHYLAGQPFQTGYDPYGYNYQGHMFNGTYCNVYLGRYGYPPYEGDDEAYLAENPGAENVWCWPHRNVELVMKWDDVWLANTDCDGDGLLDRHYGFDSYIGSGAWETNHQFGSYEDGNGGVCNWNYFGKIIAAPAGAVQIYDVVRGWIWYSTDGIEIGPVIWGSFAVIQRIYNDPCAGDHGLEYLSPDHAGFGGW